MECAILRTKTTPSSCTFIMSGNSHWKVVARRTHDIKLGNYSVLLDNNLQYTLMQTSIWGQIVEKIPLAGFVYRNPHYFYAGETRFGKVRVHLFPTRYEFEISNDRYLVSIHSGTTHSLLLNNDQIAVYHRYGEGNYRVLFSDEFKVHSDLLILFAAFVEMYATIDTAVAANPEGYKMANDKHPERATWHPG